MERLIPEKNVIMEISMEKMGNVPSAVPQSHQTNLLPVVMAFLIPEKPVKIVPKISLLPPLQHFSPVVLPAETEKPNSEKNVIMEFSMEEMENVPLYVNQNPVVMASLIPEKPVKPAQKTSDDVS
jgi:hypothetical protein